MKRKAELPETEPVHLRPICGIRPGIAILAGLAAIAIAASFLLLILPGLLASGGYVSFALDSDSAAVYMDGVYIGSGKGSVYYLPEGEHEFAFSIYGADAGSVTAEVEKKVFGSLFVHRVKEIPHEIVLTPEIEDAVITRFASSIAEWSRVLDFSDRYPYPPLFQDLASDAIALGFDDISDAMLYGALHVTSEAVYGDFRAARDMLEGSAVSDRSTELDLMEDLLRRIWTEGMAGDGCTAAAGSLPAGTAAGGFISYDGTGMDIGNTDAVTFPEVKEHAKHVTVPAFSRRPACRGWHGGHELPCRHQALHQCRFRCPDKEHQPPRSRCIRSLALGEGRHLLQAAYRIRVDALMRRRQHDVGADIIAIHPIRQARA